MPSRYDYVCPGLAMHRGLASWWLGASILPTPGTDLTVLVDLTAVKLRRR